MVTFPVKTFRRYPLGSVTPAGSVREWSITERRYWGHGVPFMSPFTWQDPGALTASGSPIVSGFHTERHALNVLESLEREHRRLWKLSGREDSARRERTGEIFTHPAAVAFYTSVDQSCAVGGPRAGEAPLWRRMTLVTRTRDGVTYTDDVTIQRNRL